MNMALVAHRLSSRKGGKAGESQCQGHCGISSDTGCRGSEDSTVSRYWTSSDLVSSRGSELFILESLIFNTATTTKNPQKPQKSQHWSEWSLMVPAPLYPTLPPPHLPCCFCTPQFPPGLVMFPSEASFSGHTVLFE